MPRKKRHEEHLNHEAWAIPYGDLVTLLLAFFVVMYAISSVNEGKYRVLSDSLVAAFRGTPRRSARPGRRKAGGLGRGREDHARRAGDDRGQPRSMLAPLPVKTGLPEPNRRAGARATHAPSRAAPRRLAGGRPGRQARWTISSRPNLVIVRRTDFWIEVEIKTDILSRARAPSSQPHAVGVIEKLGEGARAVPEFDSCRRPH